MGSFSSGGSKPLKGSQPYLLGGLGTAQNVFNDNQANLKDISGIAADAAKASAGNFSTSPFVDNAQGAARTISNGFFLGQNPGQATYDSLMGATGQGRFNPANPTQRMAPANPVNPGDQFSSATAGGKYLNNQPSSGLYSTIMGDDYLKGNPFLDGEIERTNADVTKNANRLFGSRGMGTGIGSAFADVVSKNLADNEGSLRYQNFNDSANRQLTAAGQSDAAFGAERGRMESAAGQLSDNFNTSQQQRLAAAQASDNSQSNQVQQMLAALGLTGQLEGAQYAGYAPTNDLLKTAGTLPYVGLDALQSAMANLSGAGRTQSGPGLGASLVSGLASGAGAALASDRRLKKNIEKTGALKDGLGIYEYEYTDEKHGKGRFRGVMADEVAKLRPWALGPKIDGEFATVDYSKLGAA